MSMPRILDLFAGAGGAGVGYERAGFAVYAVDIAPQPNSPHPFHLGNALQVLAMLDVGGSVDFHHRDGRVEWLNLTEFDASHASPPCQGYLNLGGVNRAQGRDYDHPQLIAVTRDALMATGLPWVIENVADAGRELRDPVRVCGTGLGLPLRRHRLFEANFPLVGVACKHDRYTTPRYWTGWRPKGEYRLSTVVQVYGNAGGRDEWPAAMGIDWMTPREMCEAIPPAYTEHIGGQILDYLRMTKAVPA